MGMYIPFILSFDNYRVENISEITVLKSTYIENSNNIDLAKLII